MEQLRLLNEMERQYAYDQVFREAFPPAELKPLGSIERMIAAGQYDFLGYFRDGEGPLGYAGCWKDGNLILLDYLCVGAQARNGGIGGRVLALLRAYYPAGTIFIGEAEAPVGDPERDALISRRLAFYQRNGAVLMDYDCALFGVRYRTLLWADGPVDQRQVQRRHDGIYRRDFSPELYARAVQIPLAPGESVKSMQPWLERPEDGQ